MNVRFLGRYFKSLHMNKFLWVIFGGYFIAWAIGFVNFESQKEQLQSLQKKILSVGLLLHFGILICYAARGSSTISQLIEWVSPFLITLIAAFVEWRGKIRFFTLFALPGAMILMLLNIQHQQPLPVDGEAAQTLWFWIHISFMLVSFAGFFTAVSSALMYLLQSRQIKSKHPGKFFLKLPALDTLDRTHFRAMVWGSILFTLGILSGLFWATHLQQLGPIIADPKVIMSFITCALYWVIISLRLSNLRRGQKIALGTLIAFAFLFTTIAISYVMPSAFHRGL